jgi:hypothetical protein
MAQQAALALLLIASGKATRYNPGVMDRVVENRLGWHQLTQQQVDNALGFVALADKQYIGRYVLIELPTGEMKGPYLVADCGARQDQEHLDGIGFAVDLSYELAQDILTRMDAPRQGVRVWLMGEADDNPGVD